MKQQKTYRLITLGCKVNQFESESIEGSLGELGLYRALEGEPADICIINTCSVTGKASMQSRQETRKAARANPGARIIVTGCYAQTSPEELDEIEEISEIFGHSQKHKIVEIISEKPPDVMKVNIDSIRREKVFAPFAAVISKTRTRPYLKIQDGCDSFCTYCIVPHARGPSRSMSLDDAIQNIRNLSAGGAKEVVLTGVHLGCYGKDLLPEASMYRLLREVDAQNLIPRIRLSSIEPHELTDEIIDLAAGSANICDHFHIPLQSGDNQILERMGRPYTREYFQELLGKITDKMPDAGIGADVLVGFPGESEAAFMNTFELIDELPVTYLHVFPFSPRKGTPAYNYKNKVNESVVKERTRKLRKLGADKKKAFLESMDGKKVQVLVESKTAAKPDHFKGHLKGYHTNYAPVLLDVDEQRINDIVEVKVRLSAEDQLLVAVT